MGMASVFYDVLNYLVIDSCMHPSGYSERACASKHVQHATQNDLVIYDRGYPAFWLYALFTPFVNAKMCRNVRRIWEAYLGGELSFHQRHKGENHAMFLSDHTTCK
jgi:hypothetical protein